MENPTWWTFFEKYSKTLTKSDKLTPAFKDHLMSTIRLFSLFHQQPEELRNMIRMDLAALIFKAERLLKDVRLQEERAKTPTSQIFYLDFSKTIQEGLKKIRPILERRSADTSIPAPVFEEMTDDELPAAPPAIKAEKPAAVSRATDLGQRLTELNRKYVAVMEQQHQEKKKKGLKETDADEADRLESFLEISDHWLKHLKALEYSHEILNTNLTSRHAVLEKPPLPLQFRLEQNKPTHTFRLIRANSRKPYPEDVSILDIINGCYSIPMYNKEGKQLVDDPEVIRFIRLHSYEDDLLNFKQDSLSRIAGNMYGILVDAISELDEKVGEVIERINKTPIQDLEAAFTDINPEECKALLRLKFQSLLPGINERRYREETKQPEREKSVRTLEIMEDYEREFVKYKEQILGDLKATVAVAYWLRRMLISVLRNNYLMEERYRRSKDSGDKNPAQLKFGKVDFLNYLAVGTSITIGDDDIANFNISPDDVISSEMSIQRVDRTDKWIAVRKSEKNIRMRKNDFFSVIRNFVEKDLNPALEGFRFNRIDLNKQLLPEIHERLADEERIDIIRSGILGTTISSLEVFRESKEFHTAFRRYFKKPDYDTIHYPDSEKLRLIARGLMHANTSILQMKYRRILRVKEEIAQKIQLIQAGRLEPPEIQSVDEPLDQGELMQSLLQIIKKIQSIMVFAKPSLIDVKLDSEDPVVIIKSDPSETSFTNNSN